MNAVVGEWGLPIDSWDLSFDEIHVLIVDADPEVAAATADSIEAQHPAILTRTLETASDALDWLEEKNIDAIVSDYELPEMDGLTFLKTVRHEYADLPFILFTDAGSETLASEAISAGVTDYLRKQPTGEQYAVLANRIENAVAQRRIKREYRETRARFQSLTQNAPFAVVTVDEDSTIQYANDSLRDVFGYDPKDVIGDSLRILMPDRFEQAHREAVDRYLQTGERALDWSWVELPGRHADGHEVTLGITFGELAGEGTHLFTAIIRDITEQKRIEAERKLLYETIRVAAEAETFLDGLHAVIKEVCDTFELAYGEAWVPAEEGEYLIRTEAAYTIAETFEPFKTVSGDTTFGPHEGLPGRAWAQREVVWMPNVSELTVEEFPRVDAAADVGLKAAFGLPIFANEELVAVLSFYMTEEKETDDQLVETVTTVATELGELIERKQKTDILRQREQELKQQHTELERLNRLNTLIRDIIEATIEAETRGEIEQLVCQRFIDEDPYVFAWIGEIDRQEGRVQPRAAAGDYQEYPEEITITTGDDPTAEGPTGRAIQTEEVQVVQNLREDPAYEPWREQARERGFRSSAAVPILDDDRLYGVLNIYAGRSSAFDTREQDVLAELGRAIGKAISAREQREAFLTDKVVELEFRSQTLTRLFRETTGEDVTVEISFDRVVTSENATSQFLTVKGLSAAAFTDALKQMSSISEVQVLEDDETRCRVKAVVEEQTLAEVLADFGGRQQAAEYRDGEFSIVADLPFGTDVRAVVEAAKTVYPDLKLVAQVTGDRQTYTVHDFRASLDERLTDRQRTALAVAYYSGFFEWPRGATGQELAGTMNISPPTFHQHLRAGERKCLQTYFDDFDN